MSKLPNECSLPFDVRAKKTLLNSPGSEFCCASHPHTFAMWNATPSSGDQQRESHSIL